MVAAKKPKGLNPEEEATILGHFEDEVTAILRSFAEEYRRREAVQFAATDHALAALDAPPTQGAFSMSSAELDPAS